MQTIAKWTRKVLNQFITVYQWIIEFSLEKMWLEVIVKQNKDVDDMLDVVNNELINVCWEYLEEHKLSLDKFQLATIVMDLYTQTISRLDAPFKVIAKENKALVQEYLEKNKSKRETLERIKKENNELDEEIAQQKKANELLMKQQKAVKNVQNMAEPVMPSENWETGATGFQAPQSKKPKARWTDALAITDFVLPH